MRPKGYHYLKILKNHLGSLDKVFNGELIYPRQMELHLPANHKIPCNFHCSWCQGRKLNKGLGRWEIKALKLLTKIGHKIPYYTLGGQYTEALLNPYSMAFLSLATSKGANVGIHTNGSMLKRLEDSIGWLTEYFNISKDQNDYLSVSLDAGTTESHKKGKNLTKDWFSEIMEGLRMAVKIRGDRKKSTIRIAYLLNEYNSSLKEIKTMIKLAKDIGVDSLRFSIPYDYYGEDFEDVKCYRNTYETVKNKEYEEMLKPLMSKSLDEKPYIFYFPPFYQDVNEMNFKQCIYSYYQISFGADGYVYKCSSSASPTFKGHRLGKITDNVDEFNKMVIANQNKDWDVVKNCWGRNVRCSRMGLEINRAWRDK